MTDHTADGPNCPLSAWHTLLELLSEPCACCGHSFQLLFDTDLGRLCRSCATEYVEAPRYGRDGSREP